MDIDIIIAIVGGLIHMLLATLIPCLLKDNKEQLFENVKKVFVANKQSLLTSTIIIMITIFVACKISNNIDVNGYSETNNNSETVDFASMFGLNSHNGSNSHNGFNGSSCAMKSQFGSNPDFDADRKIFLMKFNGNNRM